MMEERWRIGFLYLSKNMAPSCNPLSPVVRRCRMRISTGQTSRKSSEKEFRENGFHSRCYTKITGAALQIGTCLIYCGSMVCSASHQDIQPHPAVLGASNIRGLWNERSSLGCL